MQANSSPMTPPPTTTSRAGTVSMSSAPVLVITPGRLLPAIGGVAVTDPGARMIRCAETSCRPPLPSSIASRVRLDEPRLAVDQRDPARLEQLLHPADKLVHSLPLVSHQGRQVHRGLRDRQPKLPGPLGPEPAARWPTSAPWSGCSPHSGTSRRPAPSRPGPPAPRAAPQPAPPRSPPAPRRGRRYPPYHAEQSCTVFGSRAHRRL